MGDSLDLSRKASATDRDIIVFCGVRFMAETAKILNPSRTVLLPSLKAGCSLAASITADDVRALKARFPGVPVVTYVNTYADVKAESDICCTSGNAAAVVESLGSQTVIFLPDEYLARNVARETGKHIIFPTRLPNGQLHADTDMEYDMVGWNGRCEVHEQFNVADIANVRAQFPTGHPGPSGVSRGRRGLTSGSTNAMIRRRADQGAALFAADRVSRRMGRVPTRKCSGCGGAARTWPDHAEMTFFIAPVHPYVIDVPEDIRARLGRSSACCISMIC